MKNLFLPGIDTLLATHRRWLRGHRIGLVSHAAALSVTGYTSADLLFQKGVAIRALFGPEHGFFGVGVAGEKVGHQQHPELRIPVYSLYGAQRKPTATMFRGLDLILIDLQDLGCRCYTFASTLRYVLEQAADCGLPVIVADRPIPQPRVLDGPILDPAFESFVGLIPAPLLYGMTPGETALWLKHVLNLKLDVRVAPMQGYDRNSGRGTDWPAWLPPSQGIRTWETGVCYLATVFTEALPAINNGRASNLAFQVFAAPWMKSRPVRDALNALRLPGVTFHTHPYKTTVSDVVHDGVRIGVTDTAQFKPVRTSVAILACLRDLYGIRRVFQHTGARPEFFDKLYGTDTVRRALMAGDSPAMIWRRWGKGLKRFNVERQRWMLYEEG